MRILFVLLFISNIACADGNIKELSRQVSERGDQATISLFTLEGKEYTVLNLHFSGLRCMQQPIVINGYPKNVKIKWESSERLVLVIPYGVTYENNTQNGAVYCENTKIEVVVSENT